LKSETQYFCKTLLTLALQSDILGQLEGNLDPHSTCERV